MAVHVLRKSVQHCGCFLQNPSPAHALPPRLVFAINLSLVHGGQQIMVVLLQVNANLTVYVALACLVAASGGVLFGKLAGHVLI